MKPFSILILVVAGLASLVTLLLVLAHGAAFPVLLPSGSIGAGERDLMVRATFLMLIVVIPVIILAIFIAWHYREGNARAAYTPNWEHSKMEELIWWSIPFEIVLVLAALTWTSTHQLDPARPLIASERPLIVQVVALPWKWLFFYPNEGVASLNELDIPVDRPVEFRITADAPMNSFWIPALGGQMYAMTGMTTTLHLMASTTGDFPGRSANYSGDGFAQMQFNTHVLSDADFETWVAQTKQTGDALTPETYATIRTPGNAGPVRYYGTVTMTFADIVNQYMSGPMHMMMSSPE